MKGAKYMFLLRYMNGEKIEPILDEDLQKLADQLIEYVDIYTRNINITDENDIDTLNKLKDIGHRLKTKQYNLFFDNLNIISFEKPPESPMQELLDDEFPF